MREEAIDAVTFTSKETKESFKADKNLSYATVKRVEIIGEAAFKIDKAYKNLHPEVPWGVIEGTRHILVHDYYKINYDVLWRTIKMSIPSLIPALDALILEEE